MFEDLQGPVARYLIKVPGAEFNFEGTGEEVICYLLFDNVLMHYLSDREVEVFLVCKGQEFGLTREMIEKPQLVLYSRMIYASRNSNFWDKLSLESRVKFLSVVHTNSSLFPYDEQRMKRRSWMDKDPFLGARKTGKQIMMSEQREFLEEYFSGVSDDSFYLIASIAVLYHLKTENQKAFEKEKEVIRVLF
jgi:hypothetical protein